MKISSLPLIIHCRTNTKELNKLIKIIQSDKFSGFLFQSNLDFFFHYIVFEEKDFFSFLEKIKSISQIINISQNTGRYIVNSTPDILFKIFKERQK